MKKLFTLLCCLMLSVMMLGCGADQKSNPNAGKTLKIGTAANFPPFEVYQKETKAFTGFDIELGQALGKEMGYDKVEFVDMEFKDLPQALNDKKVDVLISAITITDKRKSYLDFSQPYLTVKQKVVISTNAKNPSDSVTGKRVAVEEGTTAFHEAKKQNAKEIILCKSTEDALKLVADGKADCALADHLAAAFFLHNTFRSQLSFAGDKEYAPAAIAINVRKGDKVMLDQVNTALSSFKHSTEFQKLCRTYFGEDSIWKQGATK